MASNTSTRDWWQAVLDRFDQLPRGGKIAVMVLGFVFFWPIGLFVLAYMIWSGDMGCCNKNGRSRHGFWERPWKRGGDAGFGGGFSSGNVAFDEYREATLRQLEEDQREFTLFIDRLRRAKDQREFDEFMAERMRRKQAENGAPKSPSDEPSQS